MNASLKRLSLHLPTPLQRLARSMHSSIGMRLKERRDTALKQELFGDQAEFVPPLHIMDDGPQDYTIFKQSGEQALTLFTGRAGLKPSNRILDIGSGVGRQILQLLTYLTNGSYEGLDPIARQVRWCQERITPRYPNFKFQQIDVWSKLYNPTGVTRPASYVFPFADCEFDFVTLGSVFTHMFSRDISHYLSEITRVLKPGGRGMISYFLLNAESEQLIVEGRSTQNLVYTVEDGSKADNPLRFETAIGHREEAVREMYATLGLEIDGIEYGSWCGRASNYYQDILFVSRPV